MDLAKEVVNQAGAMREFEKPEVCKAIKVANANKLIVGLSPAEWFEREARLKKEFEERSNAPVPGKEQPEEKKRIICWSASPKADFYYKHVLNEGNPALKEAASQFNDALLDEQAKKIVELTDENERLKDQVAVIYACKENNEKYNLKQIKRLGKEISKLNSIIHDKNAVLADVAEELRLSKIREKNLTEVGQKYMKENEELREKLAGETKRVEMIRNASKEYCDYGVAANEFIKELANLYVLANNKGIINDEMLERCKNYQTYGFPANCNRETKKEINEIARGKENKKPRIPTPEEPKHDNSREDFIKKTIDSFNIRAANLGSVGSKGGNGIIDQMVGADNAEEGGDHSGKIVLCGKDFGKILKEDEEAAEELSKVLNDVIDQFLLFGEIIIKEEK